MPYADKEEQRTYQREWVAERRASFFKGKTCLFCKGTKDLELDHIKRENKVSHSIWSWSEIRRKSELSKCQILCKMCHRQKTINEGYAPRKHGTLVMYEGGGCRCDECKLANAQVKRDYRAARKLADPMYRRK